MSKLDEFALRVRALPMGSSQLVRIVAALDNPAGSLKEIAAILGAEPVLASRVMRLANSAHVGMPHSVSSLQNALVLLGTRRVKTLVVSSSVMNAFGGSVPECLDLPRYRNHSAVTALIAESIARHLRRYAALDPDEAFAAGLLHDIGKVALAALEPQLLAQGVYQSCEHKRAFWEGESGDLTHFQISGVLAAHWNFPPELVAAIGFHHTPAQAPAHTLLAHIVNIADCMSHGLGFCTFEQEIAPQPAEHSLAAIGLPLERLKVIAESVAQHRQQLETIGEALG